MVKYPHPSFFDKELTDDKLSFIAKIMLLSFDKSFRDTRDIDDDDYTFGTMFFKRTHLGFKREFQSHECPFNIKILNRNNKFIFQLGQTACRFFEETDYYHPTKKGAFILDLQPQPSLFDDQIGIPVFSNFYLKYSIDEDGYPLATVVFVSYDINTNIVAFWEYNSSSLTPSIPSDDLFTPDSSNKRNRALSSKLKKADESNEN